MHAYVFKRTQAYMGGPQGPGQGDTCEGYPGRGGARILAPGTYIYPPPIPSPHPNALCDVVGIPAGFFFSEKMTSLEISDMYFVKFDVFGQKLSNIRSMFVQQVSVQVYMSPTWLLCTFC